MTDAVTTANIQTSTMTDEQLEERCSTLINSITSVVFNYIRRGLFDEHK